MAENTRLARSILKVFGGEADLVKVRMRPGKDVYGFVRKVEAANKKAAKSRLSFD